jgi:hypothetical protein
MFFIYKAGLTQFLIYLVTRDVSVFLREILGILSEFQFFSVKLFSKLASQCLEVLVVLKEYFSWTRGMAQVVESSEFKLKFQYFPKNE